MFLKTVDVVLSIVLYGAIFLFTFALAATFVAFVFQAPWTGLILGLLLALFACWFVRGLMRDVDRGVDGLIDRLSGRR